MATRNCPQVLTDATTESVMCVSVFRLAVLSQYAISIAAAFSLELAKLPCMQSLLFSRLYPDYTFVTPINGSTNFSKTDGQRELRIKLIVGQCVRIPRTLFRPLFFHGLESGESVCGVRAKFIHVFDGLVFVAEIGKEIILGKVANPS